MKAEITSLSIGIVSSRFNNEIVEKISEACISKLQALGVSKKKHSSHNRSWRT